MTQHHLLSRLVVSVRSIPWAWWVLGTFLLVGIFVRTYHFHDWLRFNADQSRDAGIVSSVIRGETSWPLLGPKAGGTDFRLGSAFYVFQIASATMFGDRPDAMAYPDLLMSILAIPLLYAFLRLYFDRRIAFSLTAIFVVSLYAVKYSRFAWNPNSLPFWTLLFVYALHRVLFFGGDVKKRWAVALGGALGIGVQLHTLTLIVLPMATAAAFVFLALRREKGVGKFCLIVFSVATLLNSGQIASEIQTGGKNTAAFFSAIGTKGGKGSGMVANVGKDAVCFVQSGVLILTSYESSDTCEIKSIGEGRNGIFFVGGIILFVGGTVLAIRSFRRELDRAKRYFLAIVFLYGGAVFLLLVPLANEISMRFFLLSVFVPFALLGLWFEFLSEKFPERAFPIMVLIALILVLANVAALRRTFAEYASFMDARSKAGMDNVLLWEVEEAAGFILDHAGGAKTVSIDGDSKYLFKAMKSIRYLTERYGVDIVQQKKKETVSCPAFLVENTKRNEDTREEYLDAKAWKVIGRFTIFQLSS